MKKQQISLACCSAMMVLSLLQGCSSTDNKERELTEPEQAAYKVVPSYLKQKYTPAHTAESPIGHSSDIKAAEKSKNRRLTSIVGSQATAPKQKLLSDDFSDTAKLTMSVEEMSMKDFLHYTFGELLGVNYIIDKALKADSEKLTLNIKEKISPKRLVQLTEELLLRSGVKVSFNDGLYYIHKLERGKKGNVVISVGATPDTVPAISSDILQIVPLKYGVKTNIERALRQLTGVSISPDTEQGALFLQGKRSEIIRSMELISLLDTPANRGRHIGLIALTYLSGKEFSSQVSTLLDNEGIQVSVGKPNRKNLVMVPIEQIGAVAVFAAEEALLKRVEYWASVVDKPSKGITNQYFIYHPKYARAADIGESLLPLFEASSQRSSSGKQGKSTGSAPSKSRTQGSSNEDMTLVVDERANVLVFYTSGAIYQTLQPMIAKLDVLPRQVMLDITIAEVTLSDEFKHGVEWALKQGEVTVATTGVADVAGIGGFSLSSISPEGFINANFLETNDLVHVLSKPTLLVRDGVSASIAVGAQISVKGATTSDPLDSTREQSTSEYRQTGVNVSVTPTINAQGIVIMEINQQISNTIPDSSGAGGNPDIFDRSIQTEVVAESGQTVILGGLISEDRSNGNDKVPLLADIPLVGQLFKSQGKSSSRTELVMLITPRVVERTDEWETIKESFQKGLNYLEF